MKKNYTSIVSLLGMFLLIGVAYGLDIWMDALKQVALTQFKMAAWFLPATLANLLIAGLLMAWLWFIYSRADNHPVVALIYILVGLGLLFYNFVAIALASSLPLPMLLALIPKSLSSFTCAMVAVVGLQRLIFGKTVRL
ncbi:MAG: hypothetical protein A2X25_05225 [Chloroflexi bacterium GWB2_49_20]|nr:MAG: hypothetical protein A2X25_05225 [Chloroflexi bacterium GWB2_49_20]OGN77813.1 MAG: hypothetical protein A2X26_02070 [Chloroflexi bacterium GWC2_49_37]OGN86127.1 MAG: hypothetical protein A2X27_11485 [Chloroflexi bacterium GWD2_49_16]HCM96241.1 hypothetical protein [Anaerolineae bacterium]